MVAGLIWVIEVALAAVLYRLFRPVSADLVGLPMVG
jgi:hypothetical protein